MNSVHFSCAIVLACCSADPEHVRPNVGPADARRTMIDFNRHPDSYKHWQLRIDGDVAHLRMNVDPAHPFKPGYELKLNSYDLGVDMELADSIQRLRFEHPNVKEIGRAHV